MRFRAMASLALFVALCGAVTMCGAAAAELDEILAAVAAEEAAPRKQARLIYRVGNREARYEIDRVLPDRIRLFSQSGSRTSEVIGIGTRLYLRQPGGWKVVPTAPLPTTPMSLGDMFSRQLRDITWLELSAADASVLKAFKAQISWMAGLKGNVQNEGELTIFVERASGRLNRLSFEGRCGGNPCSFDHQITFNQSLEIPPPL